MEHIDRKTFDKLLIHHGETLSHCIRCENIIGKFATYLRLSEKEIKVLKKGALLHDIGKFLINPNLLYKPSKLTTEEFDLVKKHVNNIKIYGVLKEIIDMKEQHHERLNGTGYPLGLEGEHISFYGKIMSIIDVFDALYSKRCYKEKYSISDIIDIFEEGKGINFDFELTNKFIDFIKQNYE